MSGKNKIQMTALRLLLNELNFQNVQTYIQSGNILLDSKEMPRVVCEKIKKGILDTFGFHVSVLARTIEEWKHVVKNYPFSIENEKIVAFSFLNVAAKETSIAIKNNREDQYKIVDDVVYLYCPTGFGRTKLTNKKIENKLNVIATTRSLRTTLKLATI